MTTTTPLTESDVEVFISKLKQADNDKKVDLIQAFGLQLEETSDLPLATLDALTLLVSPLLKSTSHLLISAVLTSFIPFFIPFLPASPAAHLQIALHQLLPLLLEKLNDPKERIQSAARTSVALLGKKAYKVEPASALGGSTIKGKEKEGPVGYWERNVKEAMAGKGWRGKVECMKMLLIMRGEDKSRLSLKPWLAPLVDLLEDGDGNVRDQARETVVALLSPPGTPPAAKQEVKKLLLAKGVRKTIADGILARILGSVTATPAAEIPLPADEATVASRSGAATPAMDEVEVVLVASGRDLESELASMVPYFEGKETEHNWASREKSIVRIRGLLRGQAYSKHPDSFIIGLKGGIAEGLSKTLLSLRTTVAQQACALAQELPEYMGSGFDQFVEGLLPVLGKMAGFTKKIIAEKSQRSVVAIITHTTCPPRMFVAHISAGINDKNVQTRNYSTSHLKLFLDVHGSRSKNTIDTTPALLDTIEAGLKKSLADTNPAVRELARAAYWSFHSIWPSRAQPIADSLDATARKQLDKADPKGTNIVATAAPTRPAMAKKPAASSSTAALIAQARKAKAAELAAGRAAQEVQRTVSSPIISSPSIQQRARATSSQVPHPAKTPLNRSEASPQGSPTPAYGPSVPRNVPKPQNSSPQDLLSRSRSSSLVRTYSRSPPSSRGSPTISKSPLRQSDTPSGLRSPGESSSSTSGRLSVRTPNPPRSSLPSGAAAQVLGVFDAGTPPSTNLIDLSSAPARRVSGAAEIDPALKAQAAQAESVARQLLDLDIDDGDAPVHVPITPARTNINGKPNGTNGINGTSHLFKTPVNHFLASTPSRAPWDDSPRPEAMTPQLFAQLKERKHERSWWLKRQELMDKASPLKTPTPDSTSAILPDVETLEHGLPTLRNLQKLALFAEEQSPGPGGERAWREGRLFERVFEGLMGFLQPSKAIDLLEQGLVVLWEMVRNQWALFEDREDALVDTLFRLRATPNIVIHESINSLMSFLIEVSEPVFFFSELRSSLGRYIASHPDTELPQGAVYVGTKAREAGYIFGLTALGMCIMKIPPQVVQIEAPRLAPVISEAYTQREPQCRQAANLLVMAIQSVVVDTQTTIGMLDLTEAQKNLVFYLFAKNGLMGATGSGGDSDGSMDAVDGKDKVMGEMDSLLGKAKAAVDL